MGPRGVFRVLGGVPAGPGRVIGAPGGVPRGFPVWTCPLQFNLDYAFGAVVSAPTLFVANEPNPTVRMSV